MKTLNDSELASEEKPKREIIVDEQTQEVLEDRMVELFGPEWRDCPELSGELLIS